MAGAVAAASLPACSSSEAGAVSSPCPPGQPCQVNLTILHTSDIHSRLFPYEQVITQVDSTLGLGAIGEVANIGGVARMSYVIQRERARSGRVVHLDSGDCFQGAPIFNFFHGEPEVRAMDALGVDAQVVGNHEFDYGAQNIYTQYHRWSDFSLLAANYKFDTTNKDIPTYSTLGALTRPFLVLNSGGLKIGVIGMANLSSLTSVFDSPNRAGITPLNSAEVLQFYIDLLRPYVDLVGSTSHMGLEVDQRMVRSTTGLDFIMGGHNHIVINPPQELRDCSIDPANPGFVWTLDPTKTIDTNAPPPDDADPALKGPAGDYDPVNHPWSFKRACHPRRVLITHSGAFAKYVGRLDLTLTNEPAVATPDGDPDHYEPINGFEILESRYTAFPINADVPEDPVVVDLLQPYKRALDNMVDLDILVGYSPQGSKRFATNGGDSPLGNLVGTSIWLRLGVQTDFSLTNSTGIRTDLNPGPITVEQMYNIFPFDNSITKMQLSGLEVQELFDFSARRSASRGCASQIQIAGARVRLNCTGCERLKVTCQDDAACVAAGRDFCDTAAGFCKNHCTTDDDCQLKQGGVCNTIRNECEINACAEQVYIGQTGQRCATDADCAESGTPVLPGACNKASGEAEGLCLRLINPTNQYELATSNYLAGGGSGFRVLQRNTTQFDTKVQQRDALLDYMRAGRPCLWSDKNATADGLLACSVDADCGNPDAVCACPGNTEEQDGTPGTPVTCKSVNDCQGTGRCVLKTCRDEVAQFHLKRCAGAPDQAACRQPIKSCQLAGEQCKVLACIDASLGSLTDNRVEMIGR